MSSKHETQRGFGVVEIIIVVVVLGVLGFVGWRFLANQNDSSESNDTAQNESESEAFIWHQNATAWEAEGDAPDCPAQPMLKAPADLSKVTAVLYPGQTRGQYKPHGGLRFDNISDNKVTVTAPFDGYIVKATRVFAQGTTEVQYGFDIMSNCGVMTRFGHLRELPASMQAIVDKLPEASATSLIENVNPPVHVKQGDILATKVGLISEKNTFFDWGVYDYRQQNEASKSQAYQAAHPQPELAWYAVCWLQDGWLASSDQSKLSSLPAGDPNSGKNSDYCK